MARLGKLATGVCVLCGLVTVGVPLMQFFLVFSMKAQYMHILITTGASAVVAAALGLAAAFSKGTSLPALHVVAAITLASLMGSFNTQTWLDLNARCGMAQFALAGCTACACAATSTCLEQDLREAACASCQALGSDLCARVRWQVLVLPYTGLIEAVLLALPAFFSLLLLQQRTSGATGGPAGAVVDSAGPQAAPGCNEVKVMVSAWPGHGANEPEDWPSPTVADSAGPKRAASHKHSVKQQHAAPEVPEQQWQQEASYVTALQADGGDMAGGGGGYHQDSLSGGGMMGSMQLDGEQGLAVPKKKAPGLKKKLKSSVAAARGEATIGGH